MQNLTRSNNPSTEEISYREIITSIVKRFARLAGMTAALNVTHKIPRLSVDNEGNVLDYDIHDPLGTITLLIDQHEVLYGEIARSVAQQAARPLAAVTDDRLFRETGLSESPIIPMRILLVHDLILFRESLVSLLEAQPDVKVVGQVGSIREAIALVKSVPPDLVLMNMTLPDGTGVEATRSILTEMPETKVIIFTLHENEERLFEIIRAGAIGVISRYMHAPEFLKMLQGVMRGEAGISGITARRILDEFARLPPHQADETATLTTREVQVLRELAGGASNQEIAKRLIISENTVKNHVRNVLVKLHFHSRRQAAEYARQHGLTAHSPDS